MTSLKQINKALKRSLWRPRRLILLSVTTVVIVLMCWFAFWLKGALYPKPTISIDYSKQLNELAKSNQPEGEDTWPVISETVKRYRKALGWNLEPNYQDPDERLATNFEDGLKGAFDRQKFAAEIQSLEKLEKENIFGLLQDVQIGAPCIYRYKVKPFQEIDSITFEDAAAIKDLIAARLLMLRSKFKGSKINCKDAVSTFHDCLVLSQSLSSIPLKFIQLQATESCVLVLSELRYNTLEDRLDTGCYEQLLTLLNSLPKLPPATFTLSGERLQLLDTVQRIYSDDGNGNGYLIVKELNLRAFFIVWNDIFNMWWPEPGEENALDNLRARQLPDRKTTVSLIEYFITQHIKESNKPALERVQSSSLLEDELFQLSKSKGDGSVLANIPYAYGWDRIAARNDWLQSEINATRIALALAAYHSANNKYPKALNELEPSIIDTVPTDPIHGGQYCYRLVELEAGKQSYLLYSTGIDAEDNGGKFLDATEYGKLPKPLFDTEYSGFDVPFD